VQKRKYRDGFYVNWFSKKKNDTEIATAKSESRPVSKTSVNPTISSPAPVSDPITAESTGKITPAKRPSLPLVTREQDSCDVIIFRDGTEIKVKVREISGSEIKYKRCEMPDGPDYITSKSSVFMIKFSNGTREVMETPPPRTTYNQPPPQQTPYKGKREMNINAILSLFFGIVGLFIGFGILAIVFGNKALNQMEKEPTRYKGRTIATIGRSLGFIKLGIVITFIAIFVLAIILSL
jgi:hypothetical protein